MITIDDVAVALGRPSVDLGSPEGLQWALWIKDARLLIGARLGDLAGLDQDILDYVVLQAVISQVRKPDDATSISVQVDDAQVSRRYASSTGRVTILDDWWSLLDPGRGTSGAFSVRPGFQPDYRWAHCDR